MKTYLTEADTAITVKTTCASIRKPFKILQDFQIFRNSNMSSKVSSPLKTSTARQRRVESTSQLKESQSKSRSNNLTSRQTTSTRNSVNYRSSCKSPVSHKKQEQTESKSKVSESSDGSGTSVGSLTSSPKWSHIKNKFENGESISNSKTSKTASSINESKKSVQMNKTTKSNTSSSLENNSYIHRNKYLSARKDVDRKHEPSVKSENTISSTKTLVEKSRLSSSNTRNETQKLKSKCASPKNSHVNIPLANTSSLHSSYSSRKVSGGVNSVLRNSQSSPEGSVKSSRCSSPNTVSSNSPTSKSCPSKNSLTSIPTDKSVNKLFKSPLDTSNDCSNSVTRNFQASNISNLNASYLSKRNLQDSKMYSSFRGKQKHEDKPILSFNHQVSQSDKSQIVENKTVKKSIGSGLEKSPNSTLNSEVTKLKLNSTIANTCNKTNIVEDVEKIKDLAKNSQSGPKTVWVKDTVGNWVKKADTETKISSSKVASLRSKFIESSKESSTPLTKSSTTSSVPSKHIQNSRPLAKSSTTSSICDKVFFDDLSKKLSIAKDTANNKTSYTDGELSKHSLNNKESQEDKDGMKLNIVQRAVLSYEGNLTLLSPETQRRLKLVTEKVQAQTDDDKILRAKAKSNNQSIAKNCHVKSSDVTSVRQSNLSKKFTADNTLSEPVLPVRNFLSRYQQKNKALVAKEQNKTSADGDSKTKSIVKSEARSNFFTDISSSVLNKKETQEHQLSSDANGISKKTDSSVNNKSVTKLTMNFKLPNGQVDMKSRNQENDYNLQPNSSFLWRRSEKAPSEVSSKNSTASSVSLTSSDYRNYYDIENYYSSLELEIDKGSENFEEHIYIDSQESNNSSENNYASYGPYDTYQNITKGKLQNGSHDEWTDMSDDDFRKNSVSSNQSK